MSKREDIFSSIRNQEREAVAERVSEDIKSRIPEGLRNPKIAVILGTGWGNVLMEKIGAHYSLRLADIPEFYALRRMPALSAHRRELVLAKFGEKTVAMLRGRIHQNEKPASEEFNHMLRLQVEMLIKLGAEHLILTNAAGFLSPWGFWDNLKSFFKSRLKTGQVVAHNGFITVYAPPRPLEAGEFVSAGCTLKEENIIKLEKAAKEAGLVCHRGKGVMVCGPDFEDLADKKIMRKAGGTMAMMSILPEAAVAALYSYVNVYAVSFFSNSDTEEHSDEVNQRRAKESSDKLGNMLLNLMGSL